MIHLRRRFRPVVVLALALVVTAGACQSQQKETKQSSSSKDTALQRLVESSDKTRAAKTARMAFSVALPGSEQGKFGAVGVVDFDRANFSFVLDLSALGIPGGTRTEVRALDETFYVQAPPGALPEGKTWLKIDLRSLEDESGLPLAAAFKQFKSGDPTSALGLLPGTKGEVRTVGKEDVRGVETTHYAITIDIDKASRNLTPELRESLGPIFEQFRTKEFPADVWIDEEGRMRKAAYAIDISGATPPGGTAPVSGRLETTFELFDFGVDLDLEAPPADQVIDASELRT